LSLINFSRNFYDRGKTPTHDALLVLEAGLRAHR
jgi:hypothetical protein